MKAEAPLLQSESTSLGQVVSQKSVADLPLNGRNFTQLIVTTPGAYVPAPNSNGYSPLFISVNGNRNENNTFMLDGINNNTTDATYTAIVPSPDAIEEFKVQTSLSSAEFGRALGGTINMSIKSGTNELHGTAFEFLRNSDLDANNFFNSGRAHPEFQQNQFGFTLGGPIRIPKVYNGKNRSFVFMDYQGLRELKGLTNVLSVPTPQQRVGNFAGGATIYDPNTTTASPTGGFTRQPFPNNVIPSNDFSPSAQALMVFYPLPNSPGQTNNFVLNPKFKDYENQGDVKVDQTFSPKDTLFARWSIFHDAQSALQNIPGIPFGGYFNNATYQPALVYGLGAALGYVHTFSPRMVNEFRVGGNRLYKVIPTESGDQNISARYGIPGVPNNPGANGLTTINVSSLSPLGDNIDRHNGQNVYQILDYLTVIRGRHTFKMGFDHRRTELNENQGASNQGAFTFDGVFTQNPQSRAGTGNAFGDFLQGYADSSVIGGVVSDGARIRNYSAFFQDDWKVSSRLTLNLGLRYEYITPVTATGNRITNFNPATDNLIFGQSGSLFAQATAHPDRNNWAPRVGLAYQLDSKTVVRGGFGMFYTLEDAGEHVLMFNPPMSATRTSASDQVNTSTSPTLSKGFAPFTPAATFQNLFIALNARPFNFPAAYSGQWNVTLQRQVGGWAFEAAYVGNEAHKLLADSNENQPLPGPGSVNSRRPFPGWGDITFQDPRGNSLYHALQMKAQTRLGSGTLLFSYSFSKTIDDNDETNITNNTGTANAQSQYDTRAERGLSAQDIGQRFVTSYVYELPFGRGKPFLNNVNRTQNLLIGGWQVNGITTAQSGVPFTVGNSFDESNSDSPSPRPNSTGVDPNLSSGQTVQQWFNTSAFVLPAGFAFGNLGRNNLIGPGQVNFDFAAFKNFYVDAEGKRRLQFRAELYNIANHPEFSPPNRLFGTPQFGTISSTINDARDVQIGLKFIW